MQEVKIMDLNWDSDSDGDCFIFDDDNWDFSRPQRKPTSKTENARDLQSARQILESPISESGAQKLSHLARTKGYNILRDALEKGFIGVAKEMLKFGAYVNNVTESAVDSPLHIAAMKGFTEMVELLLSKGGKINPRNKTGETPLLFAVRENNIEIIRLLVTNNADVNATNNEGVTALHCTVPSCSWRNKGDESGDIARLLLSAGANVNAQTKSKQTPLFVAVREGYTEVVKALLEFKADVNLRPVSWETPLFQSINRGETDVTQMLLNNGAQVNARSTRDRCTPLHRAVKNRSESIVEVLLSMPDIEVDLKTNEGDTALHIAAATSIRKNVQTLILKGADVNVQDDTGRSPLHVALKFYRNFGFVKHTDIDTGFFSIFLTLKTDVNLKDINKKTLLHYAVQNERVSFISVLLDHGAEINVTDHLGRAPLHYAALNALRDSALPLLKRGANIHLQDDDGKTPLHLAVNTNRTKEYDTFLALLENGAETNIKDNTGKTPLHVAFKNNLVSRSKYLEVTDSLLAHGAQVNVKDDDGKTPLHYAAGNFVPEESSLSNILKYGADVNAVDNEGKTALHIASGCFREKGISELIVSGADPDIKDVYGKTPLHIAVEQNCKESVLILLNRVVESDPKDNDGKTPLHYAAKNDRIQLKVLLALLGRGANVNSKENEGKTPFHLALEYGDESNALILMNHGADTKDKDNSGKTPLHYAAKRGMVSVLSSLLKLDENVNSKDNEGKTPLYVYAETSDPITLCKINLRDNFTKNVIVEEGHCAIASILLAHGADVDSMDKCGRTELHLAVGSGRVDVVRALLKYGADINVRAYVFPNHTPVKCSKSSVVSAELEKHIIMLSVLNLPIDEMNLESIDFSSSRVKEFQTQCEIEITRSTEVTLVDGDKTITFYDILTKHRIKLFLFLKNGISSDVSVSMMLQLRNFPIFRNMIARNFRLAVERVPLIQEATVLLGDLFSIPPGICVDAITDYLRNGDLKSFITACRSTNSLHDCCVE